MRGTRDSEWMRRERQARGLSTTVLADRARQVAAREGATIKLTQQSVSGYETRQPKREPLWLRYIEQVFREFDEGDAGSESTAIRVADQGEMVEIIQLDLSLPMGPGASVDDYIEETPLQFDLGYVRSFSRTPPERLRIARGVGDSMFPTLNSNDLVWIDSTQTRLNQTDRVWAVSINGGAAIKRLRPLKGGRILVISDNPTVSDFEVDADEVIIGGRVIRFARDL